MKRGNRTVLYQVIKQLLSLLMFRESEFRKKELYLRDISTYSLVTEIREFKPRPIHGVMVARDRLKYRR